MWADDSQRDRALDMIGRQAITYHGVRNARLELQRRIVAALVVVAAGVSWVVFRAF